MNRFLRSRILPISAIMLLFSVSLAIEGYILWGVKIKEDLFLTGEVNIYPSQEVIKILPFKEADLDFPELQTGSVVRVGLLNNLGQEIFINTEFLNREGEGDAGNMVLKPINTGSEKDSFFLAVREETKIKKIHLIIRNKRLLMAAFYW